jgi:hypothetical protein
MKKHQIDYEFDDYIREQLNNNKKPELIYDRLINRGHDPTIVRRRLMQLAEERKVLGDFKIKKKLPEEIREERASTAKKSPLKEINSEKENSVPRIAKILLIMIIIVGGGALAYLFLDINIDFGNFRNATAEDGAVSVGTESYHGQIDFIEKVGDPMLKDLYPEKTFNITKSKDNVDNGIHYTFNFSEPDEDVSYKIQIWDMTTVDLSDDKFIALYEQYSSVAENTEVEEYDDIGLYKGFFDIPDLDKQKSAYFYSEENFCVLVEAEYKSKGDVSGNNQLTFMTGGRIKGIIFQLTRMLT